MNLYAESSAVLSWLLGEPTSPAVRAPLASARRVFASDLTLVESDRVLIRAVSQASLSETAAADRRATLSAATAHWDLLRVDEQVIERARRPFPIEPIRSLDALHLATALVLRSATPGLALLSLDRRVRDNARQLGFVVLPD